MKLTKTTSWIAQYRGVSFEVKRWPLGVDYPKDAWNYYLLVDLAMLPEDANPASWWLTAKPMLIGRGVYYDYNFHPIMPKLDWHGGMTFYKKIAGLDGERIRVIKLGCDYQHYQDEGCSYTVGGVAGDVRRSIDKLWELVPGLKVRCSRTGDYCAPDEGEWVEDRFISNKGKLARAEFLNQSEV